MAEDILGISGQMDISDIQASLDKLCNDLNRVGVDTDALSQKMTKALNDVAKSDEDLSTKTSRAMQVLKTAMDEATQGIQIVPEMIDNANKHVETIEGTIGRLNEQLSKTDKGSEAFNSITKQIDIQKQSLELAKGDVKDLVESYDNVRNSISQVNGAYQALGAFSVASSTANAVQSATNISVGATATTAATATAAEAAAHISNAQAATQNAEAETQNVEATRQLTDALQQYISVASGRAEIERMQSENTKELKADIKLYEQAINDIQQKLGSTDYAKNIEEATKKIEIQKEKIESYKEAISNLSSDDNQSGQGANYYNHLIQVAQDNIDSLQSKINAMSDEQQRLNADLREYTTLLEAANQIQGGKTIVQPDSSSSSTISINVEDTSLSELNTKLEESKQKLQELEAETDKFSGKPLGDKQKADLENLQSEIEKTKNEISAIQEAIREKNEETFIGRLRNDISDIEQKLSDFGQSIKDKISQPIDELKSKIGNSSIGQRFGAEFEQAKNGLNDFKDGVINILTANGKLQGEIGKVGDAFKALGIPVNGSLTAIKSVTKALWGMCATPIGAVIAAVALSFKALHTWLTKSAEGQRVLTKLSAYFGSLMSSITDIVVIFGKYLYHAFADNNAPMNSFAKSFIKTFKTAVNAAISLVSGLGTTLKGIFTLDWDTFTDGLSKTWDGLKKAGTAAIEAVGTSIKGTVGALKTAYNMFTDDKLGKELGSAFNGIFTKASSAAKLAEQELNANIQLGKEKEKQAKLDIQIAANREKIYTLTGKAKDAMIEETKALMKQKYDGQIKAQQQLYEIQKKRNQMHTASLSDIKKERDLHIDILNTQAQQMASTRMLTRMQEANKRSMENAEKQKNKKAQTDAKKEQNQENAVSSAEGKLANVIYGNAYARVKAEKEIEDAVTDAKIKAMEEGEEKIIAQRKRELEKEIQQIEEKKNALIKAERDRQKAEFDAQQAVIKAKGGKVEQWDDKKHIDNFPINEIITQYDYIEKNAVENYNKEIYASQLQSLYDYLKEYGTIQEQRYAIAKEYDDKILKATDENQKKILQKQKEAALAQTDAKKLAMGVDWGASFSGVGTVLKDLAKDVLSKVEDYMKTADFKNLNANDKKSYVDLRNNLRQEADTGFSPFNLSKWDEVAQDVKAYQDSVRKVEQISAIHSQAVKNYEKAQDELKNATSKKAKELAQMKVATAEKIVKGTGQQQTEAEDKMHKAQGKLEESTEGASKGLQNFQQILGNITSGSLSGFAKGIGKLIESIAGDGNKLGQTFQGLGGKIGGLVGAILSIIDALGEDPTNFIDELLNKITKVIEAILSQLPQIILNVLKGVGNIVGGVIKGLGNLFSGGTLFGSNVSKMEAEIAELSASNKELASAIDDLKSAIENDDNTNQQSVEAYKNAVDAQKEWNENQRKAISNRASEYSNSGHGLLGLGGRKSFNKYADRSQNSWLQAFNDTLSKFGYSSRIGSASDVWNLSNEEMKTLRDFSPKAWAAFFKAGSGGQSNPQDLVNEYIDKAGVEEELTDALNKKLTGYDWSGFKGSYSSLLKDLKSETIDFADFVTETINNAAIDSFMNSTKSQEWAKKIQQMIADAAKDGEISKAEADAIRKENDLYADYLLSERKKLIDAGVIKETTSQSEQTATGKGIEAITEDQASSLIGIGYAMQIALEQGNEVRKGISLDVSFLRSYSETIGNNISEMRDIQYQGLEQLQAINKNTAPIILIREDIASMYKLMKERY